jgi:WD40 repeat protein
MSFSPDGSELVVAGPVNDVVIWDLKRGEPVAATTTTGIGDGFLDVAFSASGEQVALADAWQGLEVLTRRPFRSAVGARLKARYTSVAFSEDGQTLFARPSTNHGVESFDAFTLKPVPGSHAGHGESIDVGLTSETLNYLVNTGSESDVDIIREVGAMQYAFTTMDRNATTILGYAPGTLRIHSRLWEPPTVMQRPTNLNFVCVAPSGKTLAGCTSTNEIELWSVEAQLPTLTLKSGLTWIHEMAFSPQGHQLVALGVNRHGFSELVVWDADDDPDR